MIIFGVSLRYKRLELKFIIDLWRCLFGLIYIETPLTYLIDINIGPFSFSTEIHSLQKQKVMEKIMLTIINDQNIRKKL